MTGTLESIEFPVNKAVREIIDLMWPNPRNVPLSQKSLDKIQVLKSVLQGVYDEGFQEGVDDNNKDFWE